MESAFRFTSIRLVLALTVMALFAGVVWAQGTGEITGLVTDPSGAVVSNVQISLTNSATGEKRNAVSSSAGTYRFPSLPVVGTYTLQLSPKGFKGVKVSGIVVSVGTIVTEDVKLELGAASEQVTVEAGAEVVQTADSSLSQLVDRNIWEKMPLEVRNQNSFIELVAGAAPQDDSGSNRGAAVNGTREGAGSYLVEGTDNNEQGQAGRGQLSGYDKGGAATSISPDAIQEYRVITNSFSAEYGKGGGFITDTVLKSGTNQIHGSAFEYNRIQALAANDWFSNRAQNKDRLVRNQFGGSLGGPIIKDRTFVFGTLEFHRVRQTAPAATVSVPTQEFIDFVANGGLADWAESDPGGLCMMYTESACPGVFHDSTTVGPAGDASHLGPIFSAVRALPGEHFPVADPRLEQSNKALGWWTRGLEYPVNVYGSVSLADPSDQNEWRASIKFDHRFSDKDSVGVVYLNQSATFHDTFAGGNNTIGPLYTQTGRGQNWAVSWNHTFSPTILNTFKASYLRHRNDFPSPLGAPGYYSYVADVGADLGNYAGLPQFFTDTQFQYLDSVSVQKGKHSFKFGGEYRRTRNGSSFYLDTYGTVLPYSIEDTLTDLAFSDAFEEHLLEGAHYYGGAYYMKAAVDSSTGGLPDPYRGFRANEVAFFVQDDWRLTPRLTVNLGLRWEYFGPPHNFKPNVDSNFYFGVPVTPIVTNSENQFFPVDSPFYASVATGNFQVRNNGIWNKDTNNWGPRIGFAYDLFGNQKFVLRAGGGIMYDRIYNNVFENIRFNPPFFSDNTIFAVGPYSTPGLFTYPLSDASRAMFNGSGAAKPLPNPRHMNQDIVTPYYEQVHFGFQWEFMKGYVLEPNYVFTGGHKLTGLSDINTYDGRTAFGSSCSAGNLYRGCRPNLNIGADNFRSNGYSSNYHGLQVSARKNYSNGLGFTANYTWSKSLDTVSDLFNNRAGGRPTDNEHILYDYGPSDFNVAHRFVGTVSYELPFAKQNRWIGGWGVNAIVSRQSGHPLTPYSSSKDLNRDGYATDRVVPTVALSQTIHHGNPADGYLSRDDWTTYTCPASVNDGLWCNAPIGRGSITGPGFVNVDFSATKRFKITEGSGITFQANFFNLLNHPNFVIPARNWRSTSTTFGKSPTTFGDNGGHRITQLAVRLDF